MFEIIDLSVTLGKKMILENKRKKIIIPFFATHFNKQRSDLSIASLLYPYLNSDQISIFPHSH